LKYYSKRIQIAKETPKKKNEESLAKKDKIEKKYTNMVEKL
jgi:uncharacterized membrane protein YgaE (UPF0421/DUF939 family)